MSDQNNYQQGYQQNYQQVNPQQGYQQNYQQVNPQQGYQQNYQQAYPQQNYQQGYQQPIGGGVPPKNNKPKTGLIVGIVIGAIVLIAGIILLIFKDKIFGSDGDKKTTENINTEYNEPTETQATTEEPTTEIAVEIEGGYDTPEDLIDNFWQGFEDCDKEQIYQCFYLDVETSAADAEYNYNNAVTMKDDVVVYVDEITVTFQDCGIDQIGDVGTTVVAAKSFHAEVPMLQIIDEDVYDILDIYDGTIFQLTNGKWYIATQTETDVQVTGVTSDDTSSSVDSGNTPSVDETMYLGYPDFNSMGDNFCGYIDVPNDWVLFHEAGAAPDADYWYQMSTPDSSAIITMCAWDADLSAEESAQSIYNGLVDEGVATDIQGATVTIGGYEAYQVYCKYGDIYLVTYSFRAEDNRLHYVAAEFPEEYITIVYNIEGTYRLSK